jgi:hypothetical protein
MEIHLTQVELEARSVRALLDHGFVGHKLGRLRWFGMVRSSSKQRKQSKRKFATFVDPFFQGPKSGCFGVEKNISCVPGGRPGP